MRHLTLWATTALVATLALTACTDDDTPDPDTANQEDAMYCQLIDPDTIAPIVGGREVKDFGSPREKTDNRIIQCSIYAPNEATGDRDLLSVYEFDFAAERSDTLRSEESDRMARAAADHAEHFRELESDGGDIGYAYYDGEVASGILVTDARSISVVAQATPEQAAEFVPAVLQAAQEFDENLDAWDAENPS